MHRTKFDWSAEIAHIAYVNWPVPKTWKWGGLTLRSNASMIRSMLACQGGLATHMTYFHSCPSRLLIGMKRNEIMIFAVSGWMQTHGFSVGYIFHPEARSSDNEINTESVLRELPAKSRNVVKEDVGDSTQQGRRR